MQEARFIYLLGQFRTDQLTTAETREFIQALSSGNYDDLVGDEIMTVLQSYQAHPSWNEQKQTLLLENIRQQLFLHEPVAAPVYAIPPFTKRTWFRWSAAAILFFLLAGSTYFFLLSSKSVAPYSHTVPKIIPGGDKATLTLANGQKVILDQASNGNLAVQGGIKIIKLDNGLLSYQGQSATGAIAYNTLTTPRGGQFQLELPDGSHVWLNSASSLRYPTTFTGNSREVELDGEAYFEVSENKLKPFKVKTSDVSVQVLGTGFNVMAYQDDAIIKTTLVHGSVRVASGSQQLVIKPGQQANLTSGARQFTLTEPDMEEVLAWKEGKFRFTNTPVQAIMRQIARWYDIKVIYKGDISDVALSGFISRRDDVEKLLDIFRATERVRFLTEGKSITVMPY